MFSISKKIENSSLPIALKWSFMIAFFITIVMTILGWFLINQQRSFYLQQNQVLGNSLVNQLARAASEPMLAEDNLALAVLAQQDVKSNLIIGKQIFDKEGLLRANSGISAIWDFRTLMTGDKDTEGLLWQTPNTKAITFYSLIHYQETTVGIALVTINRKPFDEQLSNLTNTLTKTTAALVIVSILLAFPLAFFLSSPIRELVEVSSSLHQDKRIGSNKAERKDEIGRVLASFDYLAQGMKEKRKVESAFSQFLSPSIARQVLSKPQGTELGGKTLEGSVLFCDVVGFTQISENLPPIEVGDLLNQYFKYFSMAAHHFNGTVDKFIGDCMMVLFGVPEQDKQHGLNSVTCAILIQKIARKINTQRLQAGLHIVEFRIGINSGLMLAGNVGSEHRMQFTVVGDVVNLSSRICTICEPGEILVTKDTLEQPGFRAITQAQSLGMVKVKGRTKPVYPYRIDLEHFIRTSDIDNYINNVLPEIIVS